MEHWEWNSANTIFFWIILAVVLGLTIWLIIAVVNDDNNDNNGGGGGCHHHHHHDCDSDSDVIYSNGKIFQEVSSSALEKIDELRKRKECKTDQESLVNSSALDGQTASVEPLSGHHREATVDSSKDVSSVIKSELTSGFSDSSSSSSSSSSSRSPRPIKLSPIEELMQSDFNRKGRK